MSIGAMVEQFVLQEIMELNEEMSSMNISLEDNNIVTHNFDTENNSTEQKAKEEYKVDENGKPKPRRSLRKRIRPPDDMASSCPDGMKVPKMNSDISDVEKYYLCKKVKRLPSTLETIFEEPKLQNNQKQYISTRKFKRIIKFTEDVAITTQLKLKRRKLKTKKLGSSKGFLNRKKLSMETLLKKLDTLESDNE